MIQYCDTDCVYQFTKVWKINEIENNSAKNLQNLTDQGRTW